MESFLRQILQPALRRPYPLTFLKQDKGEVHKKIKLIQMYIFLFSVGAKNINIFYPLLFLK